MTVVRHDPGECQVALARTVQPVVVDLETTGLRRADQIVSAGLLVDGVAHILFARSRHATICNLPLPHFRAALQPLERPDLVLVLHNALFDLGFLRRAGIIVRGEVRDTLKLLKLLDQDRGRGKETGVRKARTDRAAPAGATPDLNYKLKDVAAQLLGLRLPHFPGQIELAPYARHARYLACDLAGTWRLYEYLWPRLSDTERRYYQTLVSPLLPLLVDMTNVGVQAEVAFARDAAHRLDALMQRLSTAHAQACGVPLGMDRAQLRTWLSGRLGLPHTPKLDDEALRRLVACTDNDRAQTSLGLILDYRQAASLLMRLRSLPRHVEHSSGRVHSRFDDSQATGRVSSTYPNLQQLAKPKVIAGESFRSRNFLRATPGYELAVFDIGQADIRVLAHAVESCAVESQVQLRAWRSERHARLQDQIGSYDRRREELRNPDFAGQRQERPQFSPQLPADLAADFADPAADFYTTATQRILGRAPQDKAERNRFKVIILSTVNGQGPPSLAKALGCTEAEARQFLRAFAQAYPKVAGYQQLMQWQIAYTGQTQTFLGRARTVTAHRWMVSEPRVQLLVSFRGGEACWLDVVPLEPSLRVLTTYVLQAWNAKTGRLIYDHERGRRSGHGYHLFTEDGQYRLPVRNWGWRSIRRVRCGSEEAGYEGFDATARSAFNFICQGGTADICKLMMLRSQPVCRQFGARLLIQIHDELVFEVPQERIDSFFAIMKPVLQQPPVAGFRVPILVEAKRGERFGELTTL